MATTIFPVEQDGTIHAAFLMDAWTDSWATHCGQPVRKPERVEHRVEEVSCEACTEQLHRAAAARDILRSSAAREDRARTLLAEGLSYEEVVQALRTPRN